MFFSNATKSPSLRLFSSISCDLIASGNSDGKELLYNYDKTEKITHFSAKLGTFFIEVNPNYENLFMFILEHNGDLLVEVNKYYPNEDTMYFPYHPDDY